MDDGVFDFQTLEQQKESFAQIWTEFEDNQTLLVPEVRSMLQKEHDFSRMTSLLEDEVSKAIGNSVHATASQVSSFISLFSEIQSVKGSLSSMEKTLTGFLDDLATVSTDINSLQLISSQIQCQLKNRTAVRSQLEAHLYTLIVTPDLSRNLIEGEPDTDTYLSALTTLCKKIALCTEHQSRKTRCADDLAIELGLLAQIVSLRLRQFLFNLIAKLTRSNTNFQIIQQNVLVKYRRYMIFLIDQAPQTAQKVQQHYESVITKIFSHYFSSYIKAVTKTLDTTFSPFPLLGDCGAYLGGTILSRLNVLPDLTIPPIVPHSAIQKQCKYPKEELFRSVFKVLLDSLLAEHSFLSLWFESMSPMSLNSMLGTIFDKVFVLCLEFVQATLFSGEERDTISLLLMLHISYANIDFVSRSQISITKLDALLKETNAMIWKLVEQNIAQHVHSIKHSTIKPNDFTSSFVHPLSRKYSDLSSCLYIVNKGLESNSFLQMSDIVRRETELFLLRWADHFPDKKRGSSFLINNYSFIFNVLVENHSNEENELSDDVGRFHYLVNAQTKTISEFIIRDSFPLLAGLITDSTTMPGITDINTFLTDFNKTWKSQLKDMNSYVLCQFPDFSTGVAVLKEVFLCFLNYYTLFDELATLVFKKHGLVNNTPTQPSRVSTLTITHEMKNYINF